MIYLYNYIYRLCKLYILLYKIYSIYVIYHNGLCSHKNSFLYFPSTSQLSGQVYTAKIPKLNEESLLENSGNFK